MFTSQTARNNYTGNGAVDTYAYGFKIFSDDEILVKVRNTAGVEATLTKTTHYTVSGVGESVGGNVVLVNGAFDWLDGDGDLKSGYTLSIRRKLPIKQATDLRNQGSYFPEDVEDQLDKLAMIDLQQQDEVDRSVKLPETIPSSSFSPTLPTDLLLNGASKVPMLNDAGTGFADADEWPTGDEVANAQAYAVAADASADAAAASEAAAAASAAAAATAETNAETAETNAETAETAAEAAQAAAEAAQTAAEAAQAAAETAETNAETAETNAETAETNAETAATNAAASAAAALTSENNAATSETNAATSETNAAASEIAAAASAAAAAATLASAFFRDVVFFNSASSPVTLDQTHNGKLLVFDSSGGAIAVALPTIAGITLPFNIVALSSVAGNNVTFTRGGTDTFMGGGTTKALSVANTGFQLAADTDTAPDTWSVLEFGSVGDGTVSAVKTEVTAVQDLMNIGLATAVGSSALTVSLKDAAGSNPSSASPVKIPFRDPTMTSGNRLVRSVTGALSVVVSSGSTLGHASAVEQTIYVYAIDNAGTVELAVSSVLFDEGKRWTTTAEGGAGAADSNRVLYSTTARSDVAIRLIGRLLSTQATAGTWATAMSEVALPPFEKQKISASYASTAGNSLTTAGGNQIVDFATKEIDTHNAVTTGAAWKFTAPAAGIYEIRTTLTFSSASLSAGTSAGCYVFKNGSVHKFVGSWDIDATRSQAKYLHSAACLVQLAAGDYIDIRQNVPVDTTLDNSAGFNWVQINSVG